MRLTVIRTDNGYRLLWSFHHLLLDGWSVAILWRQIQAELRGGGEGTPTYGLPYRAYVSWQRRQNLEAAEEFWRTMLAGISAPTPLAIEQAGDSSTQSEQGECRVVLEEALGAALQSLTRRHGLTLIV